MNSLIDMTTAEIRERLTEIDSEMEELKEERDDLGKHAEIIEKWSMLAVEQRLRAIIEDRFGKHHGIKTAIFKANSEYNDEGYDYRNPVLVLIDSNFNEVHHNLMLDGYVIPENDEQYRYYEAAGEELIIEDFTIKF